MKKNRLLAAVLCGIMVLAGAFVPQVPAKADGTKVVTLGADLSQTDRQRMLNYFKVNTDEVQIIYITNADEREHLGSYIPLEQIGTRTLSCAYVKPTTSGGIKVKTANLTWVTGNMIATTLSTSGVKNCEVIAACPFQVSGTGALTGIIMAYEAATGKQLETSKKELATEEIVVTGTVADGVGQDAATNIVNQAKIEVIENHITNITEITNIVYNIVENNNYGLSEQEIQMIVDLLADIADEGYDYSDVQETLEAVNNNVNPEVEMDDSEMEIEEDSHPEPDVQTTQEDDQPVIEEDSILEDLDESILGDDIVTSSTEEGSLTTYSYTPGENDFVIEEDVTETEDSEPDEVWEETEWTEDDWNDDGNENPDSDDSEDIEVYQFEEDDDWEDMVIEESPEDSDNYYTDDTPDAYTEEEPDDYDDSEIYDEDTDEGTVIEEDTDEGNIVADPEEAERQEIQAMIDSLSEQAKSQYDKAVKFCKGEYQDDDEALLDTMGPDFSRSYYLYDSETGEKLSKAVSKGYLTILSKGTVGYVWSESDPYISDELNVMDKYLKKLFHIDGEKFDEGTEDILQWEADSDRALLYKDTIAFFQKMYGETPVQNTYEDTSVTEETEEYSEEEPEYTENEEYYEEPEYTEEEEYYEEPEYTEEQDYYAEENWENSGDEDWETYEETYDDEVEYTE